MRTAEKRIAERAMFLQAAYEAVGGRAMVFFDISDVAKGIGIESKDAGLLAVEMSKRGLIEHMCRGANGLSASLSTPGLDIVEQFETLPSPPPTADQTKALIMNPSNCNINIESTVSDSTQSIEIAREKWWTTLAQAGRDLLVKMLAG